MEDGHESTSTTPEMAFKTPPPPNMAANIQYFPPQMDPLAGTSTRALRENPVWLMVQDAGVLFKMLRYLPNIISPVKSASSTDELYLNFWGVWEMLIQGLLLFVELILLVGSPIAVIFLPGIVYIPVLSLVCLVIHLITWPLQGPDVCYSTMNANTSALAESHKDEKWLFVNGCATNHVGLQKNVDLLSKTFGREVIGIHNKSFGLVADVLECLIQRCFAYKTNDVRVAYNSVKPLLTDRTVTKIVLLGHSQGGIIVSLVLDQLFAEMPPENMAKLEIYTFGSAASHFSNPAISLCSNTKPASPSPKVHFDSLSSPAQQQHVISHIEHYANEYDVIPRWGVLHSVCDIQNNRYAGSVFVRMQASGHMFNQHYMDAMFPLPEAEDRPSLVGFLDRCVSVNLELAWKRAVSSTVEDASILRKNTGLKFGTGQRMLPKNQGMTNGSGTNGVPQAVAAKGSNPVMIFSRTTSGVVVGEEAGGKTVKELSRLWKYLGGKSPEDFTLTGSPITNRKCLEEALGGQ